MSDDLEAELGAPPSKPVIEGELVRAPKAPKPPKKKINSYPLTNAQVRRRDHQFTEMAIRGDDLEMKRGRLSDRERRMVNIMLKTGNVRRAAEEIGISERTAITYLKRPFVKFYLNKMRERAAKAADLTIDKVAGVLGDAVDGAGSVTPQQLAAAQVALKLLAPQSRGVNVTVNQQNNYSGVSPFADLPAADMLTAMRKNLLEMGVDAELPPPAAGS